MIFQNFDLLTLHTHNFLPLVILPQFCFGIHSTVAQAGRLSVNCSDINISMSLFVRKNSFRKYYNFTVISDMTYNYFKLSLAWNESFQKRFELYSYGITLMLPFLQGNILEIFLFLKLLIEMQKKKNLKNHMKTKKIIPIPIHMQWR